MSTVVAVTAVVFNLVTVSGSAGFGRRQAAPQGIAMRGLLVALACYAASAAPPATVRLGHITPFDGAWSGGLQMEAAVVLALEDVNAATSILPSTTLERVVKDSKCDPGLGMKQFIGTLLRLLWSGVTGLCLEDRGTRGAAAYVLPTLHE